MHNCCCCCFFIFVLLSFITYIYQKTSIKVFGVVSKIFTDKTFVKQDGYRAYVLLFGVQMLMQILGGFVLGLFENQSQTTKDVVFWVVNGALSISFALSAYLYCKMAKKDFVSCSLQPL